MKQYTYLHAFSKGFYSREFYQNVGQSWRGAGLLFILMLGLIACVLPTIKVHQTLKVFVSDLTPLVEQIPVITIIKGQVNIEQAQPYFIKTTLSQKPIAIIDTTGNTDLGKTDAFVLLTKNSLITREDDTFKNYNFPTNLNATYSATHIQNSLNSLLRYSVLLIYPIILFLYFLFGVIEILIYALLGKAFIQTDLSYKTIMRLCATALAPAVIINIVLELLSVPFNLRFFLHIFLVFGYLVFAIKANAPHDDIK